MLNKLKSIDKFLHDYDCVFIIIFVLINIMSKILCFDWLIHFRVILGLFVIDAETLVTALIIETPKKSKRIVLSIAALICFLFSISINYFLLYNGLIISDVPILELIIITLYFAIYMYVAIVHITMYKIS